MGQLLLVVKPQIATDKKGDITNNYRMVPQLINLHNLGKWVILENPRRYK